VHSGGGSQPEKKFHCEPWHSRWRKPTHIDRFFCFSLLVLQKGCRRRKIVGKTVFF
jgi:hypothetical protein